MVLKKIKQSVNIVLLIGLLERAGSYLSSQGDTFSGFIVLSIVAVPLIGHVMVVRYNCRKKSNNKKKTDIDTKNKK